MLVKIKKTTQIIITSNNNTPEAMEDATMTTLLFVSNVGSGSGSEGVASCDPSVETATHYENFKVFNYIRIYNLNLPSPYQVL